jgi:DNA repair exonuclease SbcCD nuclease subunit
MILFTADWHLKLGQKNVPVAWAKNRYSLFFSQLRELEADCNLHIIGGDLFDRLPSMEELELYFSFIRGVKIPTIIYPGNHEATKKNKTFFSQLKQVSRDINPLIHVIDVSYIDTELGFGILPYCELHRDGSIEHFDTSMPLFTHVRGEIPPHVKPEVDLNRLQDFPVVFSGDLHSHSNTQQNIVYPGSPMTTSFHRNKVETGYLLIDENSWNWMWEPFTLPQLIRKTVSSPEEMLPTEYDHTIYEIEGDIQELAGVKNSELLDKKVVKRSTEATLVMNKDMSIQDELSEYLLYVLEMPEDKIPNIIGTFNDYSQKAQME